MRALLTAAFCSTLAVAAYAQPATPSQDEAPAHISFIEGTVDIVREGVAERADPPELLVEGDIIRTGNGRAEIVFGDGTLLHLDHSAQLEVLSPERLRLTEGRVILRTSAAIANAYYVDTPGGTVRMDARGEFGISAFRDERLDVSASRGTAEIDDGSQKVIVRAGEMVTLAAPGARPQFQAFNSARWDNFAEWANDRSNGFATSASAARLPNELRVYSSTLDQYGRWEHLNPYGYVWYPAVGVAWRPYYDGSWWRTRYGWTWRGRDRWAWPTHHYGRWGFNGASWYWIPSPGWAPAWVSWGVSAGYVSWSPLGWDGRPAIGLWSRRDHPAYDPWRGWTIVPRDQFGPRRPVRPRAIDGRRLDDTVRGAMIQQNHGPGDANVAVPRGSLAVPGAAGTARRETPRVDRPGFVRRPQDASTTPSVTTPAQRPPERRVTDAPEYTPFYSVPRVGTAERNRGDGTDRTDRTDRGGRVRATDPPPAARDNERPATTSPRSSGDDGANRAVPRGAVERAPRSGGPSTQDAAGGSGDRGGSANRGGYVRGGGGSSRGGDGQGGRPGASDGGGARPRGGATGSGASGSGGTSGGSSGARPGSGGGAVRRPR